MNSVNLLDLFNMSDKVDFATKSVVDIVTVNIWPLMLQIKNNIILNSSNLSDDVIGKLTEVFTLCCSQIKKCVIQLFETFKSENTHKIILQESRLYLLERLAWCVSKLEVVNKNLLQKEGNTLNDTNDSILVTPMYFVSWIDNTFDLLTTLSNIVYRTDYKISTDLYETWKNELVDTVTSLHVSVDELLLTAMTLSKYCLLSDQHIITARSQVVLRETKALLSEMLKENIENGCKLSVQNIKEPVMSSDVNVLIDVLRDVLYVLETNTNTALLGLLVHCFSLGISPIDKLKEHFLVGNKEVCGCSSDCLESDDCIFVKEFDMYNERLLQIGSFAVSCSSDQTRILSLKSCLASLEALDPHLVPALMMGADSYYTNLLVTTWKQEIQEIRDTVFLIVDPAAFVEKSKQIIHKDLLELVHNKLYNSEKVCTIINIGCVVYDFFSVYNKYEPEALIKGDKILLLLKDLEKVQMECKIVSNMCKKSNGEFHYDVIEPKSKEKATLEQLFKRLKLLYTLINRICNLFGNKENDEQLFDEECNASKVNMTYSVRKKQKETYVKESKPFNDTCVSRGAFARTGTVIKKPAKNILTSEFKFLKIRANKELNFSVQLDELFGNISEGELVNKNVSNVNKKIADIKERSILYNYSPLKSKSLRKAVLNRNYLKPLEVGKQSTMCDQTFDKSTVMDITEALQITEILDQFTDMSVALSTTKQSVMNATSILTSNSKPIIKRNLSQENVIKLNINNKNTSISKYIWNIPVNAETVEISLDNTTNTNISTSSQPSNVTTLERLNDLDLLDNRLNDLKVHRETNL